VNKTRNKIILKAYRELVQNSHTVKLVLMCKILEKARRNGEKVKVVGCGYSFNGINCTDGFMISMKHFNKIIEVRHRKFVDRIIVAVQFSNNFV